jgi:hypothetical protein
VFLLPFAPVECSPLEVQPFLGYSNKLSRIVSIRLFCCLLPLADPRNCHM